MNTAEDLLAVSAGIWDAYFRHPFVRGIQDGTLDKARFRFYLMQDALYLEEYAKVFALGAAKAEYLSAINRERAVHGGYFEQLSVSEEELRTTARSLDNLSYTSYMLRVGYEGGEAEILAAILSCAYSYQVIAKRMLAENPKAGSDPFYGAWVREYASEAYAAENAKLIAALNAVTEAATPAKRQRLRDIFVTCSRYELKFWDMAWQQKKTSGYARLLYGSGQTGEAKIE